MFTSMKRHKRKPSIDYTLQKRSEQAVSALDTHRAYYDINAHPSYSIFGAPDFIDGEGREYRLAFTLDDGSRYPLIHNVLQMRASEDGAHVNATIDDYIKYAATKAMERREKIQLQAVHPGSTGRTRLWIKVPRKHKNSILPQLEWPETSHELATRLVYVGDPNIVKEDETAVLDVIIQTTTRSDPARKTGYVDVSGLDPGMAAALLERRLKRLVVDTGM